MDFSLNRKPINNLINATFVNFDGGIEQDNCTDINGKQISANDEKRVGKIEGYSDGSVRYFIKTIEYGSPGEILANPVTSHVLRAYNETGTRSKTFLYRQVSEDLFNMYRKFLQTKNFAYYHNVYRRLVNGEL